MIIRKFLIIYAASTCFGLLALHAQQFQASPTPATVAPVLTMGKAPLVEKQVTEVSLVLSVTDRKGHYVHGLKPQDFSIFDDSKPQTSITFFQSQTDLPLDVALVLDTSASMTSRLDAEKWTIASFLGEVVRHEDSITLFAFSDSVRAVVPIRYNWRQVSRQLKNIKPGGETALFDAVTAAAQHLQQDPRPARHIIIILSDGEENASRANLESTVSALLKAETTVYAINDGDDIDSSVGEQGETTLKSLASASGGAYSRAAFSGDVGSAFGKIRKELRSQYAIAFKPSDHSQRGFHYVQVLAGKLHVHCRSGYYAR